MLEQLRWQLTLWFVGLSSLLYVALSVSVIVIVDAGLTRLLDDELRVVSREVRPTIDYSGNYPSLKTWAKKAKELDVELLATVQLYDEKGQLIEAYGPAGVRRLIDGYADQRDPSTHVMFRSRAIKLDLPAHSYLQVELSKKAKDASMQQLIGTLALLAPFLVAALGISGYLFAGQALGPTKASLGVLRRFVADAGHEFTTPVAVILASIETLERKLPTGGAETEILAVIARAADRMASLAKDLVFLARMESPHIHPRSKVRVNEIILAVVEEFSPLAAAKNVKLIVQDLQPSYIMGHEESVRTLVSNLIKNAISYTDSGGAISVSLEKLGNQIQIIVDDTGIGIPAECLSRIFERFYRVDKSRSRAGGGSGLGLAIVKAIVDGHNGSIKVESSPIRGTRFTVTLPVRARLSAQSVQTLSDKAMR